MIEMVISQRRRSLGGFEVGRLLPFAKRRMIGPFIFFDHLGPVDLPAGLPRSVDVLPHPHIGLSTVTYLFAGEIVHRDSVGSQQPIHPGEVNWMTAGCGVTHSERFERARQEEGDHVHGIQAWVALPKENEENSPFFQHYEGTDLPVWQEKGMTARLITGEAFGAKAPTAVFSPQFYIHWQLDKNVTIDLPHQYSERAVYVAAGRIQTEDQSFGAGDMILFGRNTSVRITAEQPSIVLGLGGEPIGERFIYWNFVSSSKERIDQAKADWQTGRMKLPDFDHQEFIPLPQDATPAPNPL